jgi:ribonuclease VapC
LIVADASALVAIALAEPEAAAFSAALHQADGARIAPVNYVEVGLVLRARRFVGTRAHLDQWLQIFQIVVDEEAPISGPALEAYFRFGKGLHPARLNLGDCFAYALAKHLDAPLLYKGDDFTRTDVHSALQPT